jgi:hypothetical protein
MEVIKHSQRNRLTDTHIQNLLQISSSLKVYFETSAHHVLIGSPRVVLAQEIDFYILLLLFA